MGKRRRLKKVKAVGEDSVFNQEKRQKRDIDLEQRIPRKFTEMMELQELCKEGSGREIQRKLRKNMASIDEEEKNRREDAKRKPGESRYRHIMRLKSALDVSLRQARATTQEFPEKELNKKNPKEEQKKAKTKERLNKMKEKRKKRLENRKAEEKEKERWTDRVEFGEVVMQPPTLKAKPRKAGEVKKAGQKDFLFLKTGFQKSKKSNLSLARTKVLNDERDRVIQAYRDLKRSKMS